MKADVFLILGVFVMALGFGCATTTPFDLSAEKAEQLEIGTFKRDDCEKLFGTPGTKQTLSGPNGNYDIWIYRFVAERSGMGRMKALIVEFKEGALNGYIFLSSFEGDRSTFAKTNMAKLVFAGSTKEQVQTLLGKPAGKVRCPTEIDLLKSTCGFPDREFWMYADFNAVALLFPRRGQANWAGTVSTITFDEYGLVNNVTTATQQNQ